MEIPLQTTNPGALNCITPQRCFMKKRLVIDSIHQHSSPWLQIKRVNYGSELQSGGTTNG